MALTPKAVDSVETDFGPPAWTFGGGTALAIDLGNRISYDIDAFMDSARVIQSLVPVRNPITRDICWNDETSRPDYQYSGHYLKLIVKGRGEIDFLGSTPLLEDATVPFDFDGRVIARERPAEVIAKKIYYRGHSFKARDVFDLAGTYLALPDELATASDSPFLTSEIYARARLRIETRFDAIAEEMQHAVNPTELGRSYFENSCDLALEALDFLESRLRHDI